MKKYLQTTITLLILLSFPVSAQFSSREAGLRLGYRGGIFFQTGAEAGNAEIAYNVMLGFRNNGVQLTGLRIIYETTLPGISPDLWFGWGYGGHAGFIITDHVRYFGEDYYFRGDRFCPILGADGFLTLEYRVRELPLNISLNLKPFVELTLPSFFRIMPGDLALSISYVF